MFSPFSYFVFPDFTNNGGKGLSFCLMLFTPSGWVAESWWLHRLCLPSSPDIGPSFQSSWHFSFYWSFIECFWPLGRLHRVVRSSEKYPVFLLTPWLLGWGGLQMCNYIVESSRGRMKWVNAMVVPCNVRYKIKKAVNLIDELYKLSLQIRRKYSCSCLRISNSDLHITWPDSAPRVKWHLHLSVSQLRSPKQSYIPHPLRHGSSARADQYQAAAWGRARRDIVYV